MTVDRVTVVVTESPVRVRVGTPGVQGPRGSADYPALPSVDLNGVVTLTQAGPFGVDGSGVAYYDPAGAAAGEAASLVLDKDGTYYVVKADA